MVRKYVDNLRNVNLFATLKEDQIEAVSRILTVNSYYKNQTIFQEGQAGDTLYVVLKGKVKVCLYDEEGREYILDVIGKDGFFGELSIIDEMPRSANAVVMESTELLLIRRPDFMRLLLENPSISIEIFKVLSRRLRVADERIRWLAFLNVEGRILKYLLEIGTKAGVKVKDYIIIEKGPTQIEIANSCGCSRETVSRMIASLIKKGFVNVRRRQYTLTPGPLTF